MKLLKNVTNLAIAIAAIVSFSFAQASLIATTSDSVQAGSPATIHLDWDDEGAGNYRSLSADLQYNTSILTAVNLDDCPAAGYTTSDGYFAGNCIDQGGGIIRAGWALISGGVQTGRLGTMVFKTNPDAAPGTYNISFLFVTVDQAAPQEIVGQVTILPPHVGAYTIDASGSGVCAKNFGIDGPYLCIDGGPVSLGTFTDTNSREVLTAMSLAVYDACDGDFRVFLNGVSVGTGTTKGTDCACESIASNPNITNNISITMTPAIAAAYIHGGDNTLSISTKNNQCFYGADVTATTIAPSIDVTNTGPAQAKVGNEIVYTIGLTDTSAGGTLGTCTGHDTLQGPLGIFLVGVPRDFLYIVRAGDPDPLLNTATITCDVVESEDTVSDVDDHSVDLIYLQTLYQTDFENPPFTPGDLVGQDGWMHHSGSGSLIQVIVGQAVELVSGSGSREDASVSLGERGLVAGDILYFLFDITVNGTDDATTHYFVHFKDGGTGFNSRIFVAPPNNTGNNFTFAIGESSSSTPAASFAADFTYGVRYTLSGSYTFDTGISTLQVNGSGTIINSTTQADPGEDLQFFAFRQSGGNTSVVIDNVLIEGNTALEDIPIFSDGFEDGDIR